MISRTTAILWIALSSVRPCCRPWPSWMGLFLQVQVEQLINKPLWPDPEHTNAPASQKVLCNDFSAYRAQTSKDIELWFFYTDCGWWGRVLRPRFPCPRPCRCKTALQSSTFLTSPAFPIQPYKASASFSFHRSPPFPSTENKCCRKDGLSKVSCSSGWQTKCWRLLHSTTALSIVFSGSKMSMVVTVQYCPTLATIKRSFRPCFIQPVFVLLWKEEKK